MADDTKGKPNVMWRIILITIFICIAMILFITTLYNCRMTSGKIEMERYLEKKYGEEFIAQGLGYYWQYWGGPTVIGGTAFPKADPSLKFDIGRVAKSVGQQRIYGESYRRELWSKQKRLQLASRLKNDLVWADASSIGDTKKLYGKKIDISEAEQLLNKHLDLSVYCGFFIDLKDYKEQTEEFTNLKNGSLSQKQRNNLYNMVEIIKNHSYSSITLQIRYFNGCYRKEVRNNLEEYLRVWVLSFDELVRLKDDAVLCQIRIDDINQINKPEDVEKFINLEEGFLLKTNSEKINNNSGGIK